MALEYIVAGRRSLPAPPHARPWSWTFAVDDDEDDEASTNGDEVSFDEGSFELEEIRSEGNDDFYSFVEKHSGFAPRSVITIRKAGWDFSRAAAEVLAAALDGVLFVDGLVEEHGVERVPAADPAHSIDVLQARIEAASREPRRFFERWAAAEARAREEHDRRHPEDADRRARENDWSDL